jgi:hypothetical protein
MLLKDWSTEFVETEELKDSLPVDIEHPQVIRFVQIVFDRLKMPAIPLLCERKRNLATNLPAPLALNSSSSFGSCSDSCDVRTNNGPLAVSNRSDFI